MTRRRQSRPKRKEPNGKGSIYERAKGGFTVKVTLKTSDGRSRRVERVAETKERAEIIRRELLGIAVLPDPVTSMAPLAEFLDDWLKLVKISQQDATYVSYESAVRNHIKPAMGGFRLVEIKEDHVRNWLVGMESGRTGARTMQNSFVVLTVALDDAKRRSLIEVNPCDGMPRPRYEREDIFPFKAEEAAAILEHVKENRLRGVYHCAMHHGFRQEELFGLDWNCVDLRGKSIRVAQVAAETSGKVKLKEPKTKNSRRAVPISDETVAVLVERKAIAMREGLAGCDFVFPTRTGKVMHRSNFGNRHWTPLLESLKLEHRGFHHCRHTAATIMLSQGDDVYTVSKILGHSKPSVTLDLYAHWIPASGEKAAASVSRALKIS